MDPRLHVRTTGRSFKEDRGACVLDPGTVVPEMAGGPESFFKKYSLQVISTRGLYLVQVTDTEKSPF